MEIILFLFLFWVLPGLFGSGILLINWTNNFDYIELGTLVLSIFLGIIFGPLCIVTGLIILGLDWLSDNQIMQTEIWRKKRDTRNKN